MFSLPSFAADLSDSSVSDNDGTVRVGYFYSSNYHQINEDGMYSGYGFELIEKLRSYTGWNVEYVGFEKTWEEMFEMLDNGEIDMLSNVNWSFERETKYLFSDYDVGNSSYVLLGDSGDNRFSYNKAASFDGAIIGFLEGDTSYSAVLEYSRNNSFIFFPMFYKNEADLRVAFDNKEIDLIGTTNFVSFEGLTTFANIKDDYVYIITSKKNPELMHEINTGLENMISLEPNAISNLTDKYFLVSSRTDSVFTREEREYIESRKNNPIKCICVTGLNPVSYVNGNEIVGIIPDYLKSISEITGLSFQIYGITNNYSVSDAFTNTGAEIRLDALQDYNLSNYYDYILSIPYLSMGAVKVYNADFKEKTNKVGVIHTPDPIDSVFEDGEDYINVDYSGIYDAVTGLSDGEVDYLIVPLFVGQYICSEYDEYNLKYSNYIKDEYNLCYGVDDVVLCRILSKAISLIPANEVQEIISSNISYSENRFLTLSDLFEMYSWLPWVFWMTILAIVAFVVILLYKAYSSKREHELALENLSYFKSILGANLFAVKAEVYSDDALFTIYYFNENDPSKTGITEHLLTREDETSYRDRIYSDDLKIYDDFISYDHLKRLAKDNKPAYCELKVLDSEGHYIYVSLSAHSMPSYNENDNILIVVKNIDLSKKEEEEKRRTILLALETAKRYSESKTKFLSQMSHDIRTPLNAIVGMSTIANMNLENTAKVKECLDIIDDSSDHLLALVSDILDMTKIESGKLSFSNKRINIVDILYKSTNMFTSKVKSANIDFSVSVMDVMHEKVVSDPTRLEQIFTNVISNATKYTPPGGKVSVLLSERGMTEEGKILFDFSVKDTGIGMDEKTIEKLFNPFERAEAVEYMEGVGLGMAITKNIADALGGKIHVESEPGKGTNVVVSFAFSDEIKSSFAEFMELKGKNALVLTADSMLKDFLTAVFEEGSMRVEHYDDITPSVEKSLKEISGDYSVIVVSLEESVSDEILSLKNIRNICGPNPIIIDITNEDVSVCENLNENECVDSFLTLPVHKSNLIRAVSDALDKRSMTQKSSLKATGKGKRALIVEDVEINAIFAQAITEMKGFISDVAENGKKAVEMLEGSEDGYYSIVLMDIQMPIMNGYEATKVIRASKREYLKKIPIIAMSANTFDEDVQKCKKAGMNDHISKPVDVNRFSELVDIYVKE